MSRSYCMVKEHAETTQHMFQQLTRQQLMFQQFTRLQLEELNHKVDKIQSTLEKTTGGNGTGTNSMAAPNERRLQLKFLNQVSDAVFTGKEITGKGDNPVKVAIVDENEQVVKTGPESSAKVKVVLCEANADDNRNDPSHQDFKSDEAKIHFAKSYHVSLQEGIGDLCNAKLGQDSNWTKRCKCQLRAGVENLSGIEVQKAWTEPFEVLDSRKKLYEKHYPPSLSDDVWRLDSIGRSGGRCKRLKENTILTVEDLLFLNSVDPQRLQKMIGPRESVSKAIKHAQTSVIDETIIYKYAHPSEPNVSVVFNVVGKLKGVIDDSQHVHPSHLSESLKARASTLLSHAFENRSTLIPQSDGEVLMQNFQFEASNAAPNTSLQAEAQKVTSSTYERCEEVNSNCDDVFCDDEFFNLENLFQDVDMAANVPANNVVYAGALLPYVVSNEGQFCTQESQPGGSLSNPNTYQEQRAGTAAGGSEGMMEQFPRDFPERNKPRTRRQEQRMAGTARRPRWKQDEPRLSLRLRSRAWSQSQGLHLTTMNHGEESSSRGLPHGFRGRGGDRDPCSTYVEKRRKRN